MTALAHYTREAQRAQDYADQRDNLEAALFAALKFEPARMLETPGWRTKYHTAADTMAALMEADSSLALQVAELIRVCIGSSDEALRWHAEQVVQDIADAYVEAHGGME